MPNKRPWDFILRKRIKFFVLIVLILSLIFIFYQLFYFKQLNNELSKPVKLLRGLHYKQATFYVPNHLNQFTCIHSKELIDFSQINDDYCDCLDGSDEPGTNACSNGIFFCLHQDTTNKFKKFIPSTMVNDGLCDCCDGSDEWSSDQLPFRLTDKLQKQLGRYQTPCPNICYQ